MFAATRVKAPILIPLGLVFVLVVGALLVTAYRYEVEAREQALAAGQRAVGYLLDSEVEMHGEKLDAVLSLVARDPSIAAALEAGDRERLQPAVAALYPELASRHGISHFYLIDPSRTVLLRAHAPERHGDVVDRPTLLHASTIGQVAHGVEIGPLGTLVLRAVLPWFSNGRLVGFIELGQDVGILIEHIRAVTGVELIVLAEAAPGAVRDHAEQGDEGPLYVVAQTGDLARVPPALAGRIERGDRSVLEPGYHGDVHATSVPLVDAMGRRIGHVLVLRDVAALGTDLRDGMAAVGMVGLLAGFLVLSLLYAILDRVEREHRRQREIETRFTRLSAEHQRIVQMEKLAEVGRTISEIAHQINNPLVGVINMAQLAAREADDPARVRELLAEIGRAGGDCHAFVQRMLAFTRLSRLETGPADLAALARETIALFEQSVHRSQGVVAELPDAPVRLELDPVLIRHALFNLLMNADEASPADTAIQVTLRPAAGPKALPGWCLSVVDRGPGLPPGDRDRLFQPFFTTRPAGTGLGLAVVQHVAVVHGGTIRAANHPGGGAEFALWLPANRDSAGGGP